MECMLSFEILSMNVSSSPFLYFTTVESRGRVQFTGRTRRTRTIRLFFFTEVFPAFVLVDVDVDLFDSLHGLRQLGPVVVALWRGSQQLHQQQRVAHHPLNGLNEERAQVDVVCFPPEIK